MADGTDLLPGPSINTSVLKHEEMAGAEPRTSSEAGRSCCLWLTPTRRHCLMYGSRACNLQQRHSDKGWVGSALAGRQPCTAPVLLCSAAPPAASAHSTACRGQSNAPGCREQSLGSVLSAIAMHQCLQLDPVHCLPQ